MKTFLVLFLAPLFVTTAVFGQAAAEPASAFGLAPSAPPALAPGSGGSLMPEGLPDLDKSPRKEGDKPSKDKTAVAEDALQSRIKVHNARIKALRDPAVQAEWNKSLLAKTDYEKREIMTNYYTLLCARMAKIDGTLEAQLAALKSGYLSAFEQTRIAPTVPPQVARGGRN
jgi:hypothetical protein